MEGWKREGGKKGGGLHGSFLVVVMIVEGGC